MATTTSDAQSGDSTLPSLHHLVPGLGASEQLQVTIIFHPDVARIGERAIPPGDTGAFALGRHYPAFARPGDDNCARPLDDPYVSRCALRFSGVDDGVLLHRPEQASRCRVQGLELQDELHINDADLARGVPLLLSHTVVLLLRKCRPSICGHNSSVAPALIGDSEVMCDLRGHISAAAGSDQDVLVRGETGVGKELVAQAICAGSRRADGPLVTVNMAAVPAPLAAAFLFGNTRGAFSGADRARAGYFLEADSGTLFLDEVGDTPEEVQPLLLRALQEREIQVVGGSVKTVDVRVISATDAPIDEAECDFKSALRHRLGTIEIRVPPLREHPEDIGSLLLHSLQRACEAEACLALLPNQQSAPHLLGQWSSLFFRFLSYCWPGNVRELENFATQVVIASDDSPVIPPSVLAAMLPEEPISGVAETPGEVGRRMRDVSDQEFDKAMSVHGYEVRPVAQALGVSHQSVYRRIDKSRVYRRVSELSWQELETTLSAVAGDVTRCAEQLKVSESALRGRLRTADSVAGY